jgi:fibronectin-binding autotransporter adhesin
MPLTLRTVRYSLFCATLALLSLANASAANLWDGGGTTNNWGDALNWDNDVVPLFPVQLTFGGTTRLTPNNDQTGITVQGITFDATAGAFTIGGNAITLGTAGVPSPNATVGGNAFTNGITNSSTNAQIVNLPITLLQRNRHNFTTDVGAGALTLGGAITRQAGATAHFMPNGGAITTTLTNDASGIIGAWATTGTIGTTNPLTAVNSSWAANDGTGKIVPYQFAPANTFAAGATVTGVNSTSNVKFNAGGNLTIPAGTSMNSLFIAEDATVRVITNLGTTTFTAGGGIFRAADTAGAVIHRVTGGTITAGTSGPAELFVRTRTLPQVLSGATNGLNGPPESLTIESLITDNAGGGAVTLVKSGFGVLRLDTSVNTFSGGLYLNEGQLRPSQPGSMGTGPVYVAADAQMLQGAAVNQPNNFFIAGFGAVENGGQATQFRGGALRFNSAGGELSGTITLLDNARIGARGGQAATNAPGGILSGKITGNFNLELNVESGQGTAGLASTMPTLTLTNSANDWGGNTVVGRGRVRIGGTGEVIPDGAGKGNLVFFPEAASESMLALEGNTETVNGLTVTGAGDPNLAVITNNVGTPGTLRVGSNNTSSSFAGRFADSVGKVNLEKIGTGTLTLTGSSTHSGVTRVTAGTLALSTTTSMNNSPNSNVVVSSGATFDVTGVTQGFAPGSSQTITNNGTVTGPVTLSNGGVLNGTGNYAGGITVQSGVLTGGATGATGTLAASTLVATGGGSVQFDFGGASADRINVTGNANLSGAPLTMNLLAPVTAGSYTLISAGSITGTATVTNLNSAVGRTQFALSQNATTVSVNVTGAPASIRWDNSSPASGDGASWDDQGNQNWRNGATPDKFFEFDSVTFNDQNNGHYNVSVASVVKPFAMNVTNSAGDYVFNGSEIAGVGSLTKSGTGALTLNNPNTFSGGVTLNQGTLKLGLSGFSGNSPIGIGTLTINGGTIDNSSGSDIATLGTTNAQAWGGSFTFSGTNSVNLGTGAVAMTASPVITVNDNIAIDGLSTLTVGGNITGGTNSITKAGAGALTLGGANSYSGGTTVNGGALRLTAATAAGSGAIAVNTGTTLALGANVANSITMSGTSTLTTVGLPDFTSSATAELTIAAGANVNVLTADSLNLVDSNNVQWDGALKGSGNITVQQANNVTSPDGQQGFRVRGTSANTNFSGTITVLNNAKAELRRSTPSVGAYSPAGTGKIVLTAGDTLLSNTVNSLTTTGGYTEFNLRNNTNGNVTFGNDVEIAGTGATVVNLLTDTGAPAGSVSTMGNLRIGAGQEVATYKATTTSTPLAVAFQSVTLTGNGARFSPKKPGFGVANADAGDIRLGPIGETVAGSGIVVAGGAPRAVFLDGVNTYTGTTTVASGILQLGASNRIPDSSNMVLGDNTTFLPATFATGGFNETVGTLSLQAPGTIDLGVGASTLHFATSDVNTLWSSNTLTINNWTPGPDHVFFGNSATGLGASTILPTTLVSFAGHLAPGGARILSTGEVVPVLSLLNGDFDQDDSITAADLPAMLKALTDVNAFKNGYAMSDPDFNTIANIDSNPGLTNRDIQAMLDKLAQLGLGSTTAVPEPATFVLLAFGGLAVFGMRRKQRAPADR